MKLSAVQRTILDLAVEDSYDLLEVIARVQDALKERKPDDVARVVRESIRQLVAKGLLSVWKARAPGGEEVLLREQEAEQALADDANWVRPEVGFPAIRVLATKAGERAYYASRR